ncbi:MAG: DUF3047 domain-containing protein [Candidatus Sulfobium sp.]
MKTTNTIGRPRLMGLAVKAAIFLSLLGILAYPAASYASVKPAETVDFSGSPGAKGLPAGWSLKVHRGSAQANLVAEDGEKILHMKSVSSSFALEHDVAVNIRKYHYLVWTWKAVSLPSKGDVRERSKDDQALQLLVAFKDGRVISYIWDANAPEGTVVDQSIPWPFSIKIKVVVVQSGGSDLGKWITYERNIYEDYRQLFGKEPPPVERIRVQMNTQHTDSKAEGYVRDVVFSRKTLVAESEIPGFRVVDSSEN